jgi:ubiquinone/menaquinone biosynthesis C-methylase UbiE
MRRTGRYLGFLRDLSSFKVKMSLDRNAEDALADLGVAEGQSVLDYGCGSGTYTIPAARLVGKSGKVYALDVSDRALEKTMSRVDRQGLRNVESIRSSGSTSIGLDNGNLDHILFIDVLQEIEHWSPLFEEAYRALKDGGKVSIFPMHIDEDEVMEVAGRAGLHFEGKRYRESLLLFGKGAT